MPIQISNKSVGLFIGIILIVRLLIHIALYHAGFIALTADDFGRTIVAAEWSKHPTWIWNGLWLPFHSYLLGSILKIYWELLWMSRFVAIVFGLVSIVFMYLLAQQLFNNHIIGLVSAGLLSVNPLHVWLCSVPLTEGISSTLVLIGIWAFIGYIIKAKMNYLLLAGLMFGLANGFRFESWVVSFIFSGLLIWQSFSDHLKKQNVWVFLLACLPWLFPAMWILGNYLTTGDPLAFASGIREYKRQTYGQIVSYWNYVSTFLRIDPYVTILGLGGLVVCLRTEVKFWAKLSYVIFTLVPLGVFIGLHGGQLEPLGNYLRYLAPFSFFFYPALSYLLFAGVQKVRKTKLQIYVLSGLLGLIAMTQLTSVFRFTNDPSAQGVAVGEMIKQLRQANPVIASRPVMIELSYWQYLAIKVGANDIDTILYDRDLNYRRDTPSLFMTNEQSFRQCLWLYDVSYLIVKDPVLQSAVEQTLGLSPVQAINGYLFYPTDQIVREGKPADVPCLLKVPWRN